MLHTVSRSRHCFPNTLSTLPSSRTKKCSLLRRQSTCRTIASTRQAMRRSATSLTNACCVVGQRSPRRCWCTLLSQNWDALGCSSSNRGWKWMADRLLSRGFAEEADAASHASHWRWHVHVSAGQRTGAPCSRDSSAAAGDATNYPPDLWPPNSSDLNPVDYRILDWMQERVYTVQDARPRHQRLEAAPHRLKRHNFLSSCFPR